MRALDLLIRKPDWRAALESAFRLGGKRMLCDVMTGLLQGEAENGGETWWIGKNRPVLR